MTMDRQRLEYAAEGFLSVMRRVHAGRANAADVQVKTFSEYSPEDRSALIAAIGHALKMAGPEFDKQYQNWLTLKAANAAA